MSETPGGRLQQCKIKAAQYCAKGERSPKQVIEKLQHYGMDEDEAMVIYRQLREENYVNELRFSRAFANDKFKYNKWGKRKIAIELAKHRLTKDIIQQGLDYINEEDYLTLIDELLSKKWASLNGEGDEYKRKKKTVDFLVGKGFESFLVFDQLKILLQE